MTMEKCYFANTMHQCGHAAQYNDKINSQDEVTQVMTNDYVEHNINDDPVVKRLTAKILVSTITVLFLF